MYLHLLLHLLLLARATECADGHQLWWSLNERVGVWHAIDVGLVEAHRLLLSTDFNLVRKLRNDLVFLSHVTLSHFDVGLEDYVLLHSVIALLLQRYRL